MRVSDDYGVVVAGSDTPTELLAVLCFKVFFRSHQDIGGRVKLQVFCRPLLGQVVRHDKERLVAKSKPFRLLRRRYHLISFSCADGVGEQRIPTIENVCHGIFLMFPQFDFGVHTTKSDMAPVILTGSYAVELFVIQLRQFFSAGRVCPYPVLKALLDKLLLRLSDCGLFFIEYRFLFALVIFDIVKDTHIFQVQGFLDNLIGVDTGSTVGVVCLDIASVVGFALDIPLA